MWTLAPSLRHGIPQRSHSFHHHFHYVSGGNGADALGRSGWNQVAGHERHDLRDVANDGVEREDEIPGVAALADRSVDPGFHANSRPGIDFVGNQRSHGTEGVKPLGASPLAVFVL